LANTLADKSKVSTKTDPQVDNAVREKIVGARIALLLKAPFFGNLATRLEIVNADAWCPTAATDGRKLYYNSEFINDMPIKQVEFLIGHEVLHCVYDHMNRRGERDPRLWNIADDYCVNQDLLDQNIGEKIPEGLFDTKYRGWSAEEVYDDLYKNADKINIDELLEQLLDDHLDGDETEEGNGSGNKGQSGDDGEDKSSSRPQLTDEEKKQIRDEIKQAVISAAQTTGVDKLPSGVKRLIKDLTSPQLNWRELLQQQIQSTLKADYSWMRPSRRGWHIDAILPGNDLDKEIDICVAIDASGSMGDDQLRDILGEIKGIMESYNSFVLHLWTFDTEVYNLKTFTSENIDEIMEYELQGGGGTAFDVNWTFMKDNQIEPKKFVMFTDGYAWDSWGDPDYCDTLFVIHGSTTIEAPFGITTYYDLDKAKA